MIPDGEYTAVVDRIEDTLVTLELSDDDDRYNLVVGSEELPQQAVHVDAILTVSLQDESLVDAVYQPDTTERRQEDAQSRFDRLSRRPPSGETDDSTDL